MSSYIYTFKQKDKEIEVVGYNLWNGAKNAGLTISRADKLSNSYLNNVPFEKRERIIWTVGEYGSMEMWTVKQRYNK